MTEIFSFQLANKEIADEFWFAEAKAFWDFGIKDDSALKKVKRIISSGSNLQVWRKLDAKEKDIQKRKKVLDEFLNKLSRPNPKPLKRGKVVKVLPPFGIGDLLTFQDDKGNFYGAVVSHAHHDTKGKCVVHLLNYRSHKKPGREELVNAGLMVHEKELKQYPTDGWANPIYTNIHGFLLTAKGYKESKVSFEKVGEVSFHEYGYFKDGLRTYCDMMKYSWDILPEFAVLNYKEKTPGKKERVLLSFYTNETSVSGKEISTIISSFKEEKPVSILSQLFDPKDIYCASLLWTTNGKTNGQVVVRIGIKGYDKMNTYLVNNILSRVFGSWLDRLGLKLDAYYFTVEEYNATDDTYKKLSIAINDLEKKAKQHSLQ